MSALPQEPAPRPRRGLLGWFRRETPHIRRAAAPEGRRLYAIGDIHGRADQLELLLRQIECDRADTDEKATVIFLGDYIDRGPQIRRTLDLLVALAEQDGDCRFLKGNHEEALLRFLDEGEGFLPWLVHGGEATLLSYEVERPRGGYPAGDQEELRKELLEKLPPAHLRFLRSLETRYSAGELFFVHAGVRPGVALEEQVLQDLLWIREPFLSSEEDHGAIIVHGHSVTQQPEHHANRVAVDTGAYATGVLTAAVFTPEGVSFLSSSP